MKLRTLNFIILTSAVVVFVGAGCGQTSKNKVTSSVNVGNQVVEEEGEAVVDLEEEAEEGVREAEETVTEGSVEEIDTSGWLTYENEEYGFSLRYPRDWTYEEKSLTPPEEGVLSIRFLSRSDRNIIDSINYTDQPVGVDVRVIESSSSPLQYYQEQGGNLGIKYSETELESGLVSVAYNDPGLSEGIYRNIFSDKNGVIIDIRTFSEQNLQSETFTQFMNFLQFNS